jgi:prophage tail gpP-like protein
MSADITLTVNGKDYTGWESVDITLSMETLTGVFNIGMSDNIKNTSKPVVIPPQIVPGESCSIAISGETVITGYIDKVSPAITKDTHSIMLQGRDKSGDLCDCSMVQPINQWKTLKLEQLITRICQPFGIPVTVNVDTGLIVDNFVIEQGATCFESIQKLGYARQCLVISDGQGGVLITRSGSGSKAVTALIEGQNIEEVTSDYDFSQRFSQYLCKGQRQGDDNTTVDNATGPSATVNDPLITRYRPLLIIYDGQATPKDCQLRATWEAANRRGKSIKLTVTVAGWQQADGTLWAINSTVYFKSVYMGVDGVLLISAINFKFDGQNGEKAILTLTSVEAYTISKPVIQKSNQYLT